MNDKPSWMLAIFCLLLFLTGFSQSLSAGILTIETQTTVQTTDNQLDVTVNITNKGDEPAYNPQINLFVLGEKLQGRVKTKIVPGSSEIDTFRKTFSGLAQGRYPLTVVVDFYDANQYPFSALSGLTFFIGEDVNGEIAVTADDLTMDREGVLTFHIKNMGHDSLDVSANLMLPKEFSSTLVKKSLQIDTRSDKRISFDIGNFSARNGGKYPVYCFFEYDKNNIHHTTMAGLNVSVKLEDSWFHRMKWLWVGVVSVFLLLLIRHLISKKSQIAS